MAHLPKPAVTPFKEEVAAEGQSDKAVGRAAGLAGVLAKPPTRSTSRRPPRSRIAAAGQLSVISDLGPDHPVTEIEIKLVLSALGDTIHDLLLSDFNDDQH
jgi:hypothetical protein